ncbi:MAG: hypothetical protein QOG64_1714 [Acidimicrobiaceae bacterium]|nr:hypothetical protein [Acidimicrobiaceae bacterium]
MAPDPEFELDEVLSGGATPSAMARLAATLGQSAKAAGAGAVASGRWLAEWAVDNAPRIPIRDHDSLVAQHEGRDGGALADELIRKASRASAAVGAATGAVMSAEELLPPAWISLPIELVVETLAVASIEMKLVGELHEAFGHPVPGSPGQRGTSLVRAWAERRGVTAATIASTAGLTEVFGQGTRKEIVRIVRRRLLRRMGRNLATAGPFLAGAAAGAEVNRRATRSLGEALVRDLAPS